MGADAKVNIVGSGMFGEFGQQVDAQHRAARVSLRPPDKGVYGSYRMAMNSGIVAAGMTGPLAIWEMRWFPLNVVAIIRRLRFMATTDSTAFAQGSAIFSLFRASRFSALDATGGVAAPTILGMDQAKSARFAPTQLQSTTQAFVILNTANTGLTGGTKTLDSNALSMMVGSVGASPAVKIVEGYFIDPTEAGREPEELRLDEGLIIRCELIAATGTWKFIVEVEWDEVDPARYYLV